MFDDNKDLEVPIFRSEIPEHLISSLSPKEKWQYEQISIQGKQNVWLIQRSVNADKRQNETDQKITGLELRVQSFEDIKKFLKSNWLVASAFITMILVPLLLAYFGAWISKWFEKHP